LIKVAVNHSLRLGSLHEPLTQLYFSILIAEPKNGTAMNPNERSEWVVHGSARRFWTFSGQSLQGYLRGIWLAVW